MTITGLRIFLFSIVPLLYAGAHIWLDKGANSRERRLEVVLIYLFALSVAGSGIGNSFAHFFLSDTVAELIGWPTGNPFQLEVAFANLAIGILGILSVARRDGAREATVIAVTVFSVGATIVHLMDIVATGNLAPGNTLQNFGNLVRPALLILFLAASRRAERAPESEVLTAAFEMWRVPLARMSGYIAAVVATGFGIGFAIQQPFIGTALGILIGGILVYRVASRSIATVESI
jgi:hypothetical protein